MKVSVDKTKCIGCGACASIEPTVFHINPDDGKSEADASACTSDQCQERCKEAAVTCPVAAITVEEEAQQN